MDLPRFETMESFPLSDGSLLWLTTRLPVDHAGHVTEAQIQSDVAGPATATEPSDPAPAAAEWPAQQAACQ